MGFFRFPHTPHLAWLGSGAPRDDKVLSPREQRELLAEEVVVEEKVDGANVGLSLDEEGTLRAQNRGSYLAREHSQPQFKPLFRWLAPREQSLSAALFPHLMLFGEWCYAVHSIRYTRLPDWFLVFDVYDQETGSFWSTDRRDALAHDLGLSTVPALARGRFGLPELQGRLGISRFTDGPAEGLYVRREAGGTLLARAKLVRPEFVQAIDTHWSRRTLETNALGAS
jgi:hypothetical protein